MLGSCLVGDVGTRVTRADHQDTPSLKLREVAVVARVELRMRGSSSGAKVGTTGFCMTPVATTTLFCLERLRTGRHYVALAVPRQCVHGRARADG